MLTDAQRSAVEGLIKEATAEIVMPLFRNLPKEKISDKGSNDLVTEADIEVEKRLTKILPELLPGSTVVGEEAVHEDANVLDRLSEEAPVWIIDPVDGTGNFTRGSETFAVMLALAKGGVTEAGFIYAPVTDEMLIVSRGAGVELNQTVLTPDPLAPDIDKLHGAVHTGNLPKEVQPLVKSRVQQFASNRQLYCAGHTYLQLAKGQISFTLFGRAKPWDHAAGALILEELGGRSAFRDGLPYRPDILGRAALIGARDAGIWETVRDALFHDLEVVY